VIYLLIGLVLMAGVLLLCAKSVTPEAIKEAAPALSSLSVYPLRKEGDRLALTVDGVDYFSWEGETDSLTGTPVWDWHGRMGDRLGMLLPDGGVFATGELFTLRDRKDILLAHLPEDGWPITDMMLFLPEGTLLPEIRPDGFALAEVYRLKGEFQDECYERVCDITDPSRLCALAESWLSGGEYEPAEGEYERYRIRLYSAEIPGLYAALNLHVNRATQAFVLERYRFRGDTLLPTELQNLFE